MTWVIHLESTGSTNAYARDLAAAGEMGPLWVRADRQMSGRGRLDRSWVSEPGNLFASALYPAPPASLAPNAMSFASALAACDAVESVAGRSGLALKWPNDLLLDGKKVCGILLENFQTAFVSGIGINVAHHPRDTRWPATHLAAHLPAVRLKAVFVALMSAFANWYDLACARGFGPVREAWTERAFGIGRDVKVRSGGRVLAGRFIGLGKGGELVLRTKSSTIPIVAGDVEYG